MLGPLYIYGTAEDTNFKFRMLIDDEEAYAKIAKLGQLRTGSGSRDLLLNILGPRLYLRNG